MMRPTQSSTSKPSYQPNQSYRPFSKQNQPYSLFCYENDSGQNPHHTSTQHTIIEDELESQAPQRKKSSQHISFFDGLFCCFTYTVGSLLPKPKITAKDQ